MGIEMLNLNHAEKKILKIGFEGSVALFIHENKNDMSNNITTHYFGYECWYTFSLPLEVNKAYVLDIH